MPVIITMMNWINDFSYEYIFWKEAFKWKLLNVKPEYQGVSVKIYLVKPFKISE